MDQEEKQNSSDELEKYKKLSDEYLDNWKRERADFINYKKDEAKRVEEFIKFSNEGLILEIIDVLDNLDVAMNHVPPDTDKKWLKGLEHVKKDFMDLLKKHGVERIKAGDNFDPVLHEAVDSEETEGKLEEVRTGYTMHGKVIRPARVKFTK